MNNISRTILIIIILFLTAFILGIRYFGNSILDRYSPSKINITENKISIIGGFIQPVTIERLKVDSIGKEKRPTKYTIEYITTCTIKQQDRETPTALETISLHEAGNYNWSEENVDISISHPDGLSKRINPEKKSTICLIPPNFITCPLKFEKEKWYFLDFQDPIFIGVYIYVDKNGSLLKYESYSDAIPFK